MPLALDPNETFEVVLRSDQARPETDRPTFLCRHLIYRERRDLRAISSRAADRTLSETDIDALLAVCDRHLAGWRNLQDERGGALAFPPAGGLATVLTPPEIWEMAAALLGGGSLDADEKKESGSPSPSSSDGSAGPAVSAPAAAATP